MFKKIAIVSIVALFSVSICSAFGQSSQTGTKAASWKSYHDEIIALQKDIKAATKEYRSNDAGIRKDALKKQAALGRGAQYADARRAIMYDCLKKQADLYKDFKASRDIIRDEMKEAKKAWLQSNRDKYLPNAKDMKLNVGKKE